MNNNFGLIKWLIASFLLAASQLAAAAPPQAFGDYTVHFSAFSTDTLQPAMAEAYNIVRSKNRGMMTISVRKKDGEKDSTLASFSGLMDKPVRANITASASNLTGQFRTFKMREVDEGNSIYYLSEFHVAHEEMLTFSLQILPEGSTKTLTVEFRQKFYTQ
ncbi:MAG: DUF4426 domain-containing protein [Ectothiorhodospiraceae bacterium]|nr:DUF4426 domain-containing protein [Ectothiorhodospiraceae bacterium]